MTMTRQQAWELLTKYNHEPFHLRHAVTVEHVMGWYAQELGYGDEKEFWSVVGLLHDLDFEQWPQEHCVKSQELMRQAGVDLFVVETMMTLADARAAVLAIRSVSDRPIFVTFTCDESGRCLSGTDVAAALVVLQGMGVSAFGLNCSTGPEQMLKQLRRLRDYARVPLIAKPNAGMPVTVDGKTTYDCTPEEFVRWVPDMLQAGTAIFGGCCGTDEDYIAALAGALKNAKFVRPEPKYPDLLPAATEKDVRYLPVDAGHGPVVSGAEHMEDGLTDALEDGFPMVAVAINSWEDVDALADCQYMISKPLCLVCDQADLLEAALRIYQGRALYEGGLTEEELKDLAGKYGVIY